MLVKPIQNPVQELRNRDFQSSIFEKENYEVDNQKSDKEFSEVLVAVDLKHPVQYFLEIIIGLGSIDGVGLALVAVCLSWLVILSLFHLEIKLKIEK